MPVYLFVCDHCGARREDQYHALGEECPVCDLGALKRDYKGESVGVVVGERRFGATAAADDVNPRDVLPTMDDMRRAAAQEGGHRTGVESRAEKKMKDWKAKHEPTPDNKRPLDPAKL